MSAQFQVFQLLSFFAFGIAVSSGQILSVNNTSNSGLGSLRQAVTDADAISRVTEPTVYIDFQAVQIATAPARAEIILSTSIPLGRPIVFIAGGNYPKPLIRSLGGRVFAITSGLNGTISIQNLRFEGSILPNASGTINAISDGISPLNLELYDSEFVGNEGTGNGVAISCTSPGSSAIPPLVKLVDCRFENNRLVRPAGNITGSFSNIGSAIFTRNSRLIAEDCLFSGNISEANSRVGGGAVGIIGSPGGVEIRRCVFRGNLGPSGGTTGLLARSDQTSDPISLLVEDSLFIENDGYTTLELLDLHEKAPFSATIRNTTFTGNIGEISSVLTVEQNFGQVDLLHCTIANNRHRLDIGSAISQIGTADSSGTIARCVIAGNTRLEGVQGSRSPDIHQTALDAIFQSNGYNFIGDATNVESIFAVSGDQIGTHLAPINPRLADPADFGGPTKTCPPRPGSPLIDAIPQAFNVIGTDQRGTTRPQGSSADIGAVELPRVAYTTWNQQIPLAKDRGTTADPDGDGLNNLLEYFFGTNPNLPNQVPMKMVTNGNGTFLEVVRSATVRPAAFSNAGIQSSTTLAAGDWQPLSTIAAESVPIIPGDISLFRTLYPITPGIDPRRFFRAIAE